jgi:hypothetical protein
VSFKEGLTLFALQTEYFTIKMNVKIINENWIWKNLEGNGSRRLIEVVFWHLPWGTKGIYKKICQDSSCRGRNSNHTSPEYVSIALLLHQPVSFLSLRFEGEVWSIFGLCDSLLSPPFPPTFPLFRKGFFCTIKSYNLTYFLGGGSKVTPSIWLLIPEMGVLA